MRSNFDEYRFYRFGLRIGFLNLIHNGFCLGVKKSIGKITQPVNSYTRFPEYALMDEAIRTFCSSSNRRDRLQVLDVGSPKCFGLHLAWSVNAEIHMTDMSPLNIDEYMLMWEAVRNDAKGSAQFALQDARALEYEASTFDMVYSMSVLEHIESETGDVEALREMIRVLRPGGLLMLSVPFGRTYVEQRRKGFSGAARRTGDESLYFFQRIYDQSAFNSRILENLTGLKIRSQWTIWREMNLPVRMFVGFSDNLRGLLGFLNPWISSATNKCVSGTMSEIPSSYAEIHSLRDLYGDVVVVAEKEGAD